MSQIPIVPGKSEIQLKARGRASKIPPLLRNVPGGLYPLKSAAFEIDEYRIMAGWPVPVPDCDIEIHCLVSAEGDILGNRDYPTALVTDADMRWVADVDYYDQVTGLWSPIQGAVSPWTTAPSYAPTLYTDYEYAVGDERFTSMTVLNFDSNTRDYMWNDLSLSMGGTSGYTVIMVLSPNSIYGNDQTVVDNALWGPNSSEGSYDSDGVWTSDRAWVAFTIRDQSICLMTETHPAYQKGVAFGNAMASTAPTYVALVVNRPTDTISRPLVTMYAASGPSKVLSKALPAQGAPGSLSTSFLLGNAPFLTSAGMDMALFDLGIYGNPLNRDDVVSEITALSSIYGGDG